MCVVPQESDREVTTEEGQNFGKAHGCLFVETSAKADVAVTQAFEELVLKVPPPPLTYTHTHICGFANRLPQFLMTLPSLPPIRHRKEHMPAVVVAIICVCRKAGAVARGPD